ncbi:MAG TPA: hypothetical protein PLV86_03420 [Candidatus Fermentibacter daniensis]|mgnify:FL=1|nr:hypothetical protein [Candidatus Fermentibacter daniensis]HQM40795.1 hypothetical protein [Candidatus Fermentibacter daniensis]
MMDPNYTFTQQEIDEGKTMAGIAYITWIGLLIAYLTGKENRFVLYHCQQSIILLIAMLLGIIPVIGWLWALFCLVLLVIGALNGFGGKAVPLPLIGQFGFKLNLLKPDQSGEPHA